METNITIPSSLTIQAPTAASLTQPVADYEFRAEMIQITDKQSLDEASSILSECSKRAKALDAERRKLTDPLKKTAADIKALFDAPINRYKAIETKLKAEIAKFRLEEERRAEIARIAAEKEAERLRLESEKKAAEEQKKVEQAKALATTAEEKQAIEIAAEEKKVEQAVQLAVQQTQIQAVVAQTAPMKTTGSSVRKVWKCKVVNLVQFLKAATERPELLALVEVKQGALDRLITATNGAQIPGVETYQEVRVSSR